VRSADLTTFHWRLGNVTAAEPGATRLHNCRPNQFIEEKTVPKFVPIGYGDRAGSERTAPEVRNAAHAHDGKLSSARATLAS
jgi:hypothetical protein